jgi:hypothetical protein
VELPQASAKQALHPSRSTSAVAVHSPAARARRSTTARVDGFGGPPRRHPAFPPQAPVR